MPSSQCPQLHAMTCSRCHVYIGQFKGESPGYPGEKQKEKLDKNSGKLADVLVELLSLFLFHCLARIGSK